MASTVSTPVSVPSATVKAPVGNLFGELKKGENVTGGLKHVDKSQMTHKNPELRASSVVPATTSGTTGKRVQKIIFLFLIKQTHSLSFTF